MTQSITITRPDDWHVHLRDDAMLAAVLPFTAAVFDRAIVMPNLKPPITTTALALRYQHRILGLLPPESTFQPLMTLYLTDDTDPDDVERGHRDGTVTAVKLYPANATTNSAQGVTDIRKVHRVLERMQKIGMPLLIHGEVTNPDIDIFDREAVFIDQVLTPLLRDFPGLRVVLEHITTETATSFVRMHSPGCLGATITAHHLTISRNALFDGGLRPHHYCLPVPKREHNRLALINAATSGDSHFFLGTDSAPHLVHAKESACGCAGIFTAPCALPLYAEIFDQANALDKLEVFASRNGPKFYRLPVNQGVITLERAPTRIRDIIDVGDGLEGVHPFRAGDTVAWRIV